MTIDNTSCDFFFQLKEKYTNKIMPAKSSSEVIDYLKENYKLTPIYDEDGLDCIGKQKIEEFTNLLKGNERYRSSEYMFEIYKLDRNVATDKFYKYYLKRFYGYYSVYVYHELKTENLFSNCSLLELELTILRGVSDLDIQNDTVEYRNYLNTCYLYDESLENNKLNV